ncbi:hypothetical protein AB0C59_00530 [Streptomyces sp. NPDC048664]|uniref:hypothetical protein n=1 Tax=Streptomyces sp. NPDC048664 TaxID=3154505 RepID=UPI0034410847
MLRHEFQPGRLIAGAVLAATGVLSLGDAYGAWRTPWFLVAPMVGGGLCLAALTGLVAGAMRRGRRRTPRAPYAERPDT